MRPSQTESDPAHSGRRGGFSAIEILIIVIVLGILAAIVIPQFSNAGTQARQGAVETVAQTVRTQIARYRQEHNNALPPAAGFWTAMTTQTDVSGNAYSSGASTSGPFGPYLPGVPINPLNNQSNVRDAAAAPGSRTGSICGFEYDYTGGTANFYGTDTDGQTIVD